MARRNRQARLIPGDSLHCHTLGHSWEDFPNDDWKPSAETLIDRPFSFRCVSCGTVRRDVWGRHNGQLIARSYIYPDHYQVTLELNGDMSRRETFRVEYIARH